MPRRDMRCPGGCLLHRESVSTRLAGSPLLLTATRIWPSIHLGSLFPLPLFGSPPVARWASLRLARSPCTTVVPLWSRGSVFSASIWSPPCRSVGLPAPCAPLLHYGWAPVAQWLWPSGPSFWTCCFPCGPWVRHLFPVSKLRAFCYALGCAFVPPSPHGHSFFPHLTHLEHLKLWRPCLAAEFPWVMERCAG